MISNQKNLINITLKKYVISTEGFLLKNKLESTLIISDKDTLKNINKSARNIKDVKLINDEGTNIYDLFKYKNVLMTTSSTKKIQERVLNEKN